MKRWKRGAAMLLCLCMMTALLAGCGRGRAARTPRRVVMTGSVSTVDPAYAATPAERTLVLHLFDNLYRWTAEGAVPAAATPMTARTTRTARRRTRSTCGATASGPTAAT